MNSLTTDPRDSLGNSEDLSSDQPFPPQNQTVATATKELNARQKAFVREYICDLNATRAAIRAGYSKLGADVTGSQLLGHPSISIAVAQAMEVRNSRVNMSADTVLEEVATLAHACVDHYKVDDSGNLVLAEGAPPNAMAAIQSVKRRKIVKEDQAGNITITYEVEFRLWDKPGALKLMGRHVGIKAFSDRLEITGKEGGPIEIAAARLAELPAEDLQKHVTQLAIDAVSEDA